MEATVSIKNTGLLGTCKNHTSYSQEMLACKYYRVENKDLLQDSIQRLCIVSRHSKALHHDERELRDGSLVASNWESLKVCE